MSDTASSAAVVAPAPAASSLNAGAADDTRSPQDDLIHLTITGGASYSESHPFSTHAVPAAKPAEIYSTSTGTLYEVPPDTNAAVDGFRAPEGFQQEGSRDQSFLYSLGTYVKPVGREEGVSYTAKYFCLASDGCRKAGRVIPCKNGARTNVNKHMIKCHLLRGKKRGAETTATSKKKEKAGTIKASSINASKTHGGVGAKRCVLHTAVLPPIPRFLSNNH